MEKKEWAESYEKMDHAMREMEKIEDAIDLRSGGNDFYLPDDFAPALGREEEIDVRRRCEVIGQELLARGFYIELDENAPLKARYLYSQYIALITEGLKVPANHCRIVFNGCTGWCEDCFQRNWCGVRLFEKMKESSRRMLENLISAKQVAPEDLPEDQRIKLENAIAKAERMVEEINQLADKPE